MKNIIAKLMGAHRKNDGFIKIDTSTVSPPGPTERLSKVTDILSTAHTLDDITAVVQSAARDLAGADGASFILREGDFCFYADEDAVSPLWKGKRFPMNECVSGWVITRAESVVIRDVYYDSRVPIEAYRPTFVKSMAMVPIRSKNRASLGAIGNYWATRHEPSPDEMRGFQALADITAAFLEPVLMQELLKATAMTVQGQQTSAERP